MNVKAVYKPWLVMPPTVSVDRGKKRSKEWAWRCGGYEESSKDSVMRPSSREGLDKHEGTLEDELCQGALTERRFRVR